MKKFLLGLGLTFLGVGCGNEQSNQIPGNIIKQEKMTEIFTDISLVEGRLAHLSYPDSVKDSTQIYARTYYKSVLDQHGISQKKFERSFRFYIRNPHITEMMYEKVTENLQKKEGQSQTKN